MSVKQIRYNIIDDIKSLNSSVNFLKKENYDDDDNTTYKP
jgi:hypothetical protein